MSEESTEKTPSTRSPSKVAADPHKRPRHKPSTDGSSTRARHRGQETSDDKVDDGSGSEEEAPDEEPTPAENSVEDGAAEDETAEPAEEASDESSQDDAAEPSENDASLGEDADESSDGPAEDDPAEDDPAHDIEDDDSPSTNGTSRKLTAVAASREAISQFRALTGRTPEAVVGVSKRDDGWHVRLEVVEARRIPDSSDLLAEYDVDLDASAEIVNYARGDRYVRGRPS